MYELVLASESPRRRELLTAAGFHFTVHPSKISETLEENLTIDEQILDIAHRKAQTSVQSLPRYQGPERLVLAADTMVVLDQKALGKPESHFEAIQTLKLLSGRVHEVKTAVCLWPENSKMPVSYIETTEVTFFTLSTDDIEKYVLTNEPMDKAGSYGIQGLAKPFVGSISGSYTNVVGLPMESLVKKLREEFKLLPTKPVSAMPVWEPKPGPKS